MEQIKIVGEKKNVKGVDCILCHSDDRVFDGSCLSKPDWDFYCERCDCGFWDTSYETGCFDKQIGANKKSFVDEVEVCQALVRMGKDVPAKSVSVLLGKLTQFAAELVQVSKDRNWYRMRLLQMEQKEKEREFKHEGCPR